MSSFTSVAVVLAVFVFTATHVNGGAVGRRTKRETCAQLMIQTNDCNNNGYCAVDHIGPHCACHPGWGGNHCQNSVSNNEQAGEGQSGGAAALLGGGGDANETVLNQARDWMNGSLHELEGGVPGLTNITLDVIGRHQIDTSEDDTDDGDDVETGDDEVEEADDEDPMERVMRLCGELYDRTDNCSDRKGYCSVDSIGAFCQCSPGNVGMRCQYEAGTVMETLGAIVEMMQDPHYRMIGGI